MPHLRLLSAGRSGQKTGALTLNGLRRRPESIKFNEAAPGFRRDDDCFSLFPTPSTDALPSPSCETMMRMGKIVLTSHVAHDNLNTLKKQTESLKKQQISENDEGRFWV